ncbi:MAG: nuclear transport factor 2 family protein [Cyclobacteriaceae bacterium]|nr:nuclear transport factor 2 family protein [Cyclobacteriaceae bacterium]
MRNSLITLCLILSGWTSFNVYSQSLNPNEQRVWELEERYWELVKKGDVDNFLKLWHEGFTGWGCGMVNTFNKKRVEDWVKAVRDDDIELTYEIDRESVKEYGDVIIAYYSSIYYEYNPKDNSYWGKENTWKVTHTWKRMGDTYQIIGGMCGVLEDNSDK